MQVAGRPLLVWSIVHGLEATSITRVVCSTDSEEIAEIARANGAEVPFIRPAEHATNLASDAGFTVHALEWYRDNDGWEADFAMILRPTSPVRDLVDIDGSIAAIAARPDADCCLGVVPAEKSPYKMLSPIGNGLVVPLIDCDVPDQLNAPRQILPIAYQQNGAIHIVRATTAIRENTAIGKNILPYEVTGQVIDIDSAGDVTGIERILLAKSRNNEA